MFIGRFGKKPMQFFGLMGTSFFLLGFFMVLYLVFSKFFDTSFAFTNKPAFYIALTFMVIGSQFFLAGFIGELIARSSPDRNSYMVEETIGLAMESHKHIVILGSAWPLRGGGLATFNERLARELISEAIGLVSIHFHFNTRHFYFQANRSIQRKRHLQILI